MAYNYSHTLKYAGAEPFNPEQERDDITYREQEQLEQDDMYVKLAQVRFLANKLEREVAGQSEIPEETRAHLFRTVATDDAPLATAVDEYVDAWLAERDQSEDQA